MVAIDAVQAECDATRSNANLKDKKETNMKKMSVACVSVVIACTGAMAQSSVTLYALSMRI
jgi:hypothetical protein